MTGAGSGSGTVYRCSAEPQADSPLVLAPVCAALADRTRWEILDALGSEELSASALSSRMPVSRQAIAKHLAVLADVGLVSSERVGREVRFRAVGSTLSAVAHRLDEIGARWDLRLGEVKRIAESA